MNDHQKLELLDCACAKQPETEMGPAKRHCCAFLSGFAWMSCLGGAALAFTVVLIFTSLVLGGTSYILCMLHLPEGHGINFEVRNKLNHSSVIFSKENVADFIMGVRLVHNVTRGIFRPFGVDIILDESCALLRHTGMRTIMNLTKGVYYL
jgi:hypothetical protein